MTKIKEIVEIHSGYASAVDVRTEFLDPEKNYERITRYVPIKSHRDAIERIARALLPKDKRFYFLTGNYGTGKSHLCLMVANLFSNKSNSSELEGFFGNYAKVDESKAKELRALRKEGRYLVALCDFGNKDDFEEVVLQAIAKACEREEVIYFMDTHFKEALRKIESWKESGKQRKRLPLLSAFTQELQEKHPEYTLKKLTENLQDYREEAMVIFKEVYRSILDTEFTYEKGNLIEILKDMLSNPKFKEKYAGLIVIFDEFSYTLKDRRISLQICQSFAHLCAQVWRQAGKSTAPLVFLSTGHRPIKDYSRPEDRADFDVVADRVEEVGLTPEGMEKIIGAIVVPNRKSEIWTNEVNPNADIFNTLIPECKRMGIFDWLDATTLREEILEKIYPMHPMATHCLLKLASEVGSNNRTVFTFFSGEFIAEDQSYPFYVNTTDVLDDQNCLNLYTTDLLFTYFKDNLTSTNRELKESTRRILMDYEATIRELNKVAKSIDLEGDKAAERILKVMLIYEIVGIKNDRDNITFALYPKSPRERGLVKLTIEKLQKAKVLYYNRISDAYEFRRSETQDFDNRIENYKRDPANYPVNIAQAVEVAVPFSRHEIYLEAKGYNAAYNEDKRLKRKLVTPADLDRTEYINGEKVHFLTSLKRQLEAPRSWKESFEGWVLYVLCEKPEDIARARKIAAKNPSNRIIVVVPKTAANWTDLLLEFNSVKSIQDSKEYETFSTQDKSRLTELVSGAIGRLAQSKSETIDGRNSTWYGEQGKILLDKIANPSDAADKALETLYRKRTCLKHIDLNLSHSAKYQPNKNIALKACMHAWIQKGVKDIFSVEGNTLDDLRQGIQKWFNSLDSNQRDLGGTWHTDESKTLIKRLGEVLDITDTLLVSIPEDPGFGLRAVKDWTTDKSQDYLRKMKLGKEEVENNRIKVDQPVWKVQSLNRLKVEKNKKGAMISYRLSTKLKVTPPTKDTIVFATSNSEDPRDSKSQRSQLKAETAISIDGGNKKFRLITRDKEGNWSREIEINFIDLEKKHEIRVEEGFGEGEIIVQFVFPIDKQSFKTSVRSLINGSLEQQIVDKKTVKQILKELLRESET